SGCGCSGASSRLINQSVTAPTPCRSDVSRDFLAAPYVLEIATDVAPAWKQPGKYMETTRQGDVSVVGQQGRDQPTMPRHLRLAAQPAGGEDRAHLLDRHREVLVDDDVIELAVMRHLLARGCQALGDDRFAVLAAGAH